MEAGTIASTNARTIGPVWGVGKREDMDMGEPPQREIGSGGETIRKAPEGLRGGERSLARVPGAHAPGYTLPLPSGGRRAFQIVSQNRVFERSGPDARLRSFCCERGSLG